MNKSVLKLEKNSKYKGIELKEEELVLLKTLDDLKILSAGNMHLFFEVFYSHQRTASSISKRFSKWLEAGLVKRTKIEVDHYNRKYYYKLSKRGYWFLEQAGYLTAKQIEIRLKYQATTKIPHAHNEGLASCIVRFRAALQKEGRLKEEIKISQRGELSSHFLMDAYNRRYADIIPDWVIETEDYLICLEIDTGNQTHSIIRSKYTRYQAFFNKADIKKMLLVIFVSLDKRPKIDSPRLRRVGELKSAFPPATEWSKELELFVVPSSRLSSVLIRLLSGKAAFNADSQEALNDRWIADSNQKIASSYHLALKTPLVKKVIDQQLGITYLNALFSSVNGDLKVVTVASYMEEGRVKSHQLIRKLMEEIKNFKELKIFLNYHLVLFYETPEAAEGDILGLPPFPEMVGVDLESLSKNTSEKWEHPFTLDYVTAYKKNKMPWTE